MVYSALPSSSAYGILTTSPFGNENSQRDPISNQPRYFNKWATTAKQRCNNTTREGDLDSRLIVDTHGPRPQNGS